MWTCVCSVFTYVVGVGQGSQYVCSIHWSLVTSYLTLKIVLTPHNIHTTPTHSRPQAHPSKNSETTCLCSKFHVFFFFGEIGLVQPNMEYTIKVTVMTVMT